MSNVSANMIHREKRGQLYGECVHVKPNKMYIYFQVCTLVSAFETRFKCGYIAAAPYLLGTVTKMHVEFGAILPHIHLATLISRVCVNNKKKNFLYDQIT